MDSSSPTAYAPLFTALSELQRRVEYVKKTGRNDHHKYDYASDADFTLAIKQHMADLGIVLVPQNMTTKYTHGERGVHCVLEVTWLVGHAESGVFITTQTVGEGSDKQDKAGYKAMTGAAKYIKRYIANVPTLDDAEAHEVERQRLEEEQASITGPGQYERPVAWPNGANRKWFGTLSHAGWPDEHHDKISDFIEVMFHSNGRGWGWRPKNLSDEVRDGLLERLANDQDLRDKAVAYIEENP